MATLNHRAQRNTNIWPGFVDALATLLMVIIFLLMIFVLAQFFLSEALVGPTRPVRFRCVSRAWSRTMALRALAASCAAPREARGA